MNEEREKKLEIATIAAGFLYQGPRFERLGPNSGELFRKTVLIPFLDGLQENQIGIIDFGGTKVYSPSFLEEGFGGAIRQGYADKVCNLEFLNIPDEWKTILKQYITRAHNSMK